jgi:hypothetical protein
VKSVFICGSNSSRFEVSRNLTRGIRARQTGYATTGMRARAAEVKSLERRSILCPTNQRPEREKLIECLLTVMNVTAT